MGNDEAASKVEKASSPTQQEQVAVHPYPEWASIQAYYSQGIPLPPSYFGTAVAPGHPPHPYMWGPQPLVPPFGPPYTAMYPHGVYPHPSLGLVASPSTTDLPSKSSTNKHKGLVKKLKGLDGLAGSTGNVNAESKAAKSHSGENVAEGSSEGSDDSKESGERETQRRTNSDYMSLAGTNKDGRPADANQSGEIKIASKFSSGVTVPPSCVVIGKPMGTLAASNSITPMEDEKEIKREKRKQSNRESARRSRLRKQAEAGELATKVESLIAENTALRSEICSLKENSEKLKAENSALMEKLSNVLDDEEKPSMVVENLLSRIDKIRDEDVNEKPNGGKLYQLLDSSTRTDAVAAS